MNIVALIYSDCNILLIRNITGKLAGTTMYKSLLRDVLALKRAAVVSTFRIVYSANLQVQFPTIVTF